MARVFTTVPGATVVIEGFGEATNDTPVICPGAVAQQFAGNPDFRVEEDEEPEPAAPEPEPPAEPEPEPEEPAKGKRK